MRDSQMMKGVAGVVWLLLLSSCSLWLDTEQRQCRVDDDCVGLDLGSTCVDQVCTDTSGDGPATGTDIDTSLGVVDPPEDGCITDRDCTDEATPRCLNKTCVSAELGEHWLCPDDPVVSPNVVYSFYAKDFQTGGPPMMLRALACRLSDPSCQHPVATYEDEDGTGHVTLELPWAFRGFFQVDTELMQTFLYIGHPIKRTTQGRDLPLLSETTLRGTGALAMAIYDPEKGAVFLEAEDCMGKPQGGVNFGFEKDKDAVLFYLVSELPDLEAVATVYDEANNTATAGAINVKPGFVNFVARVDNPDGFELGNFNAQVRANAVTFIEMHFESSP